MIQTSDALEQRPAAKEKETKWISYSSHLHYLLYSYVITYIWIHVYASINSSLRANKY
jgi:hypothetical protein